MIEARPRVVVTCDKFKGTLDAVAVVGALARGIGTSAPGAEVVRVPIADGGDGSVAVALASGFEARVIHVTGPLGRPLASTVALRGDRAIVDVADICGLRRLDGPPDAMAATSFGVGEALLELASAGAREIVVGLGGSACTDGGAGMLRALGVRTLPPLPVGGFLAGVHLIAATDVDNPLLGPRGAAAIYAPQKGASPEDVGLLEARLARFVQRLGADEIAARPGAGAAGGLGFGLAVLGATLVSGADYFLDLGGFGDALADAALLVTGEGRLDHQSLGGKAPIVAARRARQAGVPVVAAVGRCDLTPEQLHREGIGRVHAIVGGPEGPLPTAVATADALERIGSQIGRRLGSTGH